MGLLWLLCSAIFCCYMLSFLPFKAILPSREKASEVVTRPFDSYRAEEVKELLARHPFSFLHVIVPVADELENRRLSREDRLMLGKKELEHLLHEGALTRLPHVAYYVYRQTGTAGESYLGIMGAASIHDYLEGRIKKHEATLEYKEVVLKEYLEVIDIHAEPVYLTMPDNPELSAILSDISQSAPYISLTLQDKTHEIWSVEDQRTIQRIQSIFLQTPALYIADGHHRCASSALYGMEKQLADPHYSGSEAYTGFLSVVIPESGTRLFEFSRLVRDLGSLTSDQFLTRLAYSFYLEEVDKTALIPDEVHQFGLYLEGKSYRLRLREIPADASVLDNLDPEILNRTVFAPILHITDLRKDKRVKFVGGNADVNYLVSCVDSGRFKAAFLSFPVPFSQFKAVADAGLVMPPKSTWFEPKFPSALVIYPLHEP